jgi:hypothetical protein
LEKASETAECIARCSCPHTGEERLAARPAMSSTYDEGLLDGGGGSQRGGTTWAGRVGLCQAPCVTWAHCCLGVAAVLGAAFVVLHLATIIITCVVAGFGWGAQAWILDILGFVAGGFFAVQCRVASSQSIQESRKVNTWICVWAVFTIVSRAIDTLMLFGVIRWSDVYKTPQGAVLWSNVVSEVVIGNAFVLAAAVGALAMLACPPAEEPPPTLELEPA